MLGIWLNWCRNYGIDEVLVNVHAHPDAVRSYLADTENSGVRVTVSHEPELLGSAGTLRRNREFVKDEAEFAVLYADVLTNADFTQMAGFHRRLRSPATIGVYHVPEPRQCGIIATDENGVVTEFVEKPVRPKSDLAFSGLMIADTSVLEEVPDKLPADIGFDLLPRLVARMFAFTITDYLVDIGTMEKYERAQSEWPGLRGAKEYPACLRA